MGPQAGKNGGQVTFTGTYDELLRSDTITGKMLREKSLSQSLVNLNLG